MEWEMLLQVGEGARTEGKAPKARLPPQVKVKAKPLSGTIDLLGEEKPDASRWKACDEDATDSQSLGGIARPDARPSTALPAKAREEKAVGPKRASAAAGTGGAGTPAPKKPKVAITLHKPADARAAKQMPAWNEASVGHKTNRVEKVADSGLDAKPLYLPKGKHNDAGITLGKNRPEAHHVSKRSATALRQGNEVSASLESAPKQQKIDYDCEGRKYEFGKVVVNFANVGATYGKTVLKKNWNKGDSLFHWEGVRRCIQFLAKDQKLKVIGVCYENFKGPDVGVWAGAIPADIEQMCEMIWVPRSIGDNFKSSDDEATIICAYRRNCRFIDNDNYRDWKMNLRNEKIRTWLNMSQERMHVRFLFDSGLGGFELLQGNLPDEILQEKQGRDARCKDELEAYKKAAWASTARKWVGTW